MEPYFADSAFFIALLNPRDRLHAAAVALYEQLLPSRRRMVTSQPVLGEVLTRLARIGPFLRGRAVQLVYDLEADAAVTIVPQTSALFAAGFELFQRRSDKLYSFTDCMSMAICHDRGISEVLTADHDFEQEGFRILL